MDRRDFIKLTAVTGTSAALASCGNPEHQLIRFVPDEDITPGIAEWKPSICPVCSAGCGVNVRVMDADVPATRNGQAGVVRMNVAKKLEGLPKDPISRGGLCARGQAAIQITFHPDRIAQPMRRDGARGSGAFKPISWDEAIAELASKIDALAAAGDHTALAIVARPRRGGRSALWAEFAKRLGAPAPIAYELFSDAVLRRANAISFGREQLPTCDLARTRYAVSFGADFLGTWNSVVAQNAAFGDMRQGRPGVRGKLVQVEARMTTTGASADEWVPVKPGTEGVLALALAGKHPAADAEKITGVPAKKIERLAKELAEQKPAVAIVGGPALAHTNGLFTALAVNELNKTLGSVEQPGGIFFTPGAAQAQDASPEPRLKDLAAAKLLLVDEANPLYASPSAWKVRESLEKIPYIASFSRFVDDTTAYADLILPDHSFLESWVDASPESGAIEAPPTSAAPAMKPIHDTRATADVVIAVASKLKAPIALPWKDAEDLAKSTVNSSQSTAKGSALSKGPALSPPPSALTYAEPRFDGTAAEYPFFFLPYASPAFGDGSTAHLPWLQELPDPLTTAMWSSWVEINPKTAAQMGIATGDLVDVTSTQGTIRVPAVIFPGIAPDIVAMPVGQGHEHFTRYATGRGASAVRLIAPVVERETGSLAWAATRVRIARAGDADGSLVLFGAEMRETPHERETR